MPSPESLWYQSKAESSRVILLEYSGRNGGHLVELILLVTKPRLFGLFMLAFSVFWFFMPSKPWCRLRKKPDQN